MLRRIGMALLAATLLLPAALSAQKSSRSSSTRSSSSRTTSSSRVKSSSKPKPVSVKPRKTSTVPKKSTVAQRNSNGKIARSASARSDFMKQTGYPKGRKGYVVDHIVPLECGGADAPGNMQWQTVQAAKIKDRNERNCRR
jgi:hypothetical protein